MGRAAAKSIGLQENQIAINGCEDLPDKLAALEKALVDRDLLLLRQNEDIASLENQLARVSHPKHFVVIQSMRNVNG